MEILITRPIVGELKGVARHIGMEIFNRPCKSCFFDIFVRERLPNLRTRFILLVDHLVQVG
jgi:hypothetical protein